MQYNPSTISIDVTGVDDEDFNAFTVGYNRAISISGSAPLYVELGGALQYSFKSKDMLDDLADQSDVDADQLGKYMDPKQKFNMLSLKVPVSIMYDWKVNNSNVHIAPFAGITMRYNIFGNKKMEYNFDSDFKKKLIDEYGKRLSKSPSLRRALTCSTRKTWAARMPHGTDSSSAGSLASMPVSTISSSSAHLTVLTSARFTRRQKSPHGPSSLAIHSKGCHKGIFIENAI